jgi:hypothetical protein
MYTVYCWSDDTTGAIVTSGQPCQLGRHLSISGVHVAAPSIASGILYTAALTNSTAASDLENMRQYLHEYPGEKW